MKTIRAKLLVLILGSALGLGVVMFIVTMVQLYLQKGRINELGTMMAVETSKETGETLEKLEMDMAKDFSRSSVMYFEEVFEQVRKHTVSIANRTHELYVANEPIAQADDKLGIVSGVKPEDVDEEFRTIAPIREFIYNLPSYDVDNLAKLDLYIETESGMCIDGTFTPLGNDYADLRNEIWYTGAKEKNDVIWTGVFTGKVTGKVKVVCAAPIYDAQGNFAGVAASDISVETFQNTLDEYDAKQIKSLIFFDSNDDLMYATNSYDKVDTIQGYLRNDENFIKKNGEIIAFSEIEETGWTIAVVLDNTNAETAISNVQQGIDRNSQATNAVIVNGISRNRMVFALIAIVATVVLIVIVSFISKRFVHPINMLMEQVKEVGEGNLDAVTEVKSDDEIGKLSKAFNSMTGDLKNYMENLRVVTVEKERIGAELEVGKQIQADMLPAIFPDFSNRSDIVLYASMNPAKEVGGDFYDFFFVDNDHLCLVCADVSGKGVPAALFMVIAKTIIKNYAMMGLSPAQILENANTQLCEGNASSMFVTVWLAILDLSTGKGIAANAGHEHPALMRQNGEFALEKYKHSMAVATMEGIKFREHEFELERGDRVFIYTDGVTEAANIDNELFGEERMVESLNRHKNLMPVEALAAVRADIDEFVGEAPQFDDITMLMFEYRGRNV